MSSVGDAAEEIAVDHRRLGQRREPHAPARRLDRGARAQQGGSEEHEDQGLHTPRDLITVDLLDGR